MALVFNGGGGGGGSNSGKQLDYVEVATTVLITATADGNGGGTALINGNAVTYDGATLIIVTVSAPRLTMTPAIAGHSVYLNLYDGTNDLGRMVQVQNPVASVIAAWSVFQQRLLTPLAGSHTFNIRGWKDAAGDTTGVICGAGGASTLMPAYMRVTVA